MRTLLTENIAGFDSDVNPGMPGPAPPPPAQTRLDRVWHVPGQHLLCCWNLAVRIISLAFLLFIGALQALYRRE